MSEGDLHRGLCWALIGLAAAIFVLLLRVSAPYGRHARAGWGRGVAARWAWVAMESPAAAGFAVVFLLGAHRCELLPLLFLALWQLHYAYRAWGYPFRLPPGARPLPLVVVLTGGAFNLANAYLNARWCSSLGDYAGWAPLDPRLVGGVVLFLVGRHVNLRADGVLRRQRTRGEGYSIPRGGLYRWISCPNYLGEIIEWLGWALATWSLAGLAFALFTVANLVPRARSHHRWYRERFRAYPAARKALLPGLW